MPFAGMGHIGGIMMDIIALVFIYYILFKIAGFYEEYFKPINEHNETVRKHRRAVERFRRLINQEDSYLDEDDAPEWDRSNGYCEIWLGSSKATAIVETAGAIEICSIFYFGGSIICHILALIF